MFIALVQKLLRLQLVRYGLTGGGATLIHLLVAFACLHWWLDNLWWANLLGFLSAFVFSYSLQSLLVFKRRLALRSACVFFLVQFGALLVSIALADTLSELNNYLRVVIIALLLPLITFVIHKFWTFSHTGPQQS
ncbi:MAG: putative flippase GtrA [Motiliproteus sp.]